MSLTESIPELHEQIEVTTPTNAPGLRRGIDWRSVLRSVALVVFVASLGVWSYPRIVSPMLAARSQTLLENRFVGDAYNGLLPVGDPIEIGQPVALLDIDAIGVRRVVVEGTEAEQLAVGPGHLRGSVLPGQLGVSAILGRATTFGADFGDLDRLETGDSFRVTTGQGVHEYRVRDVTRRSADDQSAFVGEGNMLLLVTATGGDAPDGRLVVRAELTSPVYPAGAMVEHTTSTAELGLHASTRAAESLVMWLGLLVLLVSVFAPLRRRMGSRVTWIVFCPVMAVVVLQVFHQIALLLPSST